MKKRPLTFRVRLPFILVSALKLRPSKNGLFCTKGKINKRGLNKTLMFLGVLRAEAVYLDGEGTTNQLNTLHTSHRCQFFIILCTRRMFDQKLSLNVVDSLMAGSPLLRENHPPNLLHSHSARKARCSVAIGQNVSNSS